MPEIFLPSCLSFDLSCEIDHKPINSKNTFEIHKLKHHRNENPYRDIIGHVNTNSIRNNFDSLGKYVANNVVILMVSETKPDNTFPESQLLTECFSTPYGRNQTAINRGILLYISEDSGATWHTPKRHKENSFSHFHIPFFYIFFDT